mgnify:CR=1 FL=1
MWASGRVGKDTPAVGHARATGGVRVRVGRVGRDWRGGSYWRGNWSELASVFDNSGLVDLTVINICSGRRLGQKTNESFHRHRTVSQNPSLNHLYDCPDS